MRKLEKQSALQKMVAMLGKKRFPYPLVFIGTFAAECKGQMFGDMYKN